MVNCVTAKDDELVFDEANDLVSQYLNNIRHLHVLSYEEFCILYKKYKNGDEESKKKIIEHNLKLVVSIAKKYRNCGIDFIELIQEGNLGLIRAVEKYDISIGTSFSTYAYYPITDYIEHLIPNEVKCLRVPIHTFERVKKYLVDISLLKQKCDKELSFMELVNMLNVPKKDILALHLFLYDTISFDDVFIVDNGNSEETDIKTYGDCLLVSEDEMEDIVFRKLLCNELYDYLISCNIKPNTIKILLAYYCGDYSVCQIAEMFNSSKQNIDQVVKYNVDKIRKMGGIKHFKPYI